MSKNLVQLVEERPFPEFMPWWEMGSNFIRFMAKGIVAAWHGFEHPGSSIDEIRHHITEYLDVVYGKPVNPGLLDAFIEGDDCYQFHSGEFDALSYAFYRSAFETLARVYQNDHDSLVKIRRDFTKQVGKSFFSSVQNYLQLNLPNALTTSDQFAQFQENIDQLGSFLLESGYLRDQCKFSFEVDVIYRQEHIHQHPSDFLESLNQNQAGYALYIMGYPAILPSAVYLYQMFGEAQHHSSRTIEELFASVGLKASETEDFDPSDYAADRIVELWEICR
jgi:hypothetical protein